MINKIKLLLLILILILPQIIWADLNAAKKTQKAAKINLAILPFTAHNTNPSYGKIIRNRIEFVLCKLDKFNMLEKNMTQLIFWKHSIDSAQISDIAYVVKAGKDILTDYVIMGEIDKLIDYNITVKIIGVRENKIVQVASEKFTQEEKIYEAAQKLAGKIEKFLTDIPPEGLPSFTNFQEKTYLSLQAEYLQPIKSFKELFKAGYGSNLSFGLKNLLTYNLFLGISSGFYKFTGQNKDNSSNLVPLMAEAKYLIKFPGNFSFVPEIGAGICHNHLETPQKIEKRLEPLAKAGFKLKYNFRSDLYGSLGVSYQNIFEKDDNLQFLGLGLGLVYLF